MAFKHDIPIVPPPERRAGWFALQEGDAYPETLGFREAPGGVHLSKTMMLAELVAVMDAMPARGAVTRRATPMPALDRSESIALAGRQRRC